MEDLKRLRKELHYQYKLKLLIKSEALKIFKLAVRRYNQSKRMKQINNVFKMSDYIRKIK